MLDFMCCTNHEINEVLRRGCVTHGGRDICQWGEQGVTGSINPPLPRRGKKNLNPLLPVTGKIIGERCGGVNGGHFINLG